MNERSTEIDGTRTFMNTLIVLHHTGLPWMAVAVGAVEKKLIELQIGLTWTLPTLFCLSGYLMLKGYSVETIKHKFWSRCKRLAAPLFLVNWVFALFVLGGVMFGCVHDAKYDFAWFVRSLLCVKPGTTLATLWYVRTLLIFTIASPLIYFLLRTTVGQVLTLMLSVGWCVASTMLGLDETLWKIVPSFSILCFLFGAVLAVRGIDLCQFARKWWLPIVLLYLVSLSNRPFRWIGIRNGLVLSLQCLFWFTLASPLGKLMKFPVYRYLCECAFFVFAIHVNVAGAGAFRVLDLIYRHVPQSWLTWPGEYLCATWFVFIVNLACCVALYAIGKRFCPFLTRVMNGRL